ncbi:MAG: hypothetical protein GWP91_08570, partial [Rhodobacterales bacterium]|nr:hypothetical protein [Rhodobacterales bacterium]
AAADEVNGFNTLFARLDECRNQTGQLPNFVMVDYYDHGDLFEAVDALNGF